LRWSLNAVLSIQCILKIWAEFLDGFCIPNPSLGGNSWNPTWKGQPQCPIPQWNDTSRCVDGEHPLMVPWFWCSALLYSVIILRHQKDVTLV
jgi:hypothetical protein